MARAYKITGGGYIRFAANQTDARSGKADLAEELGIKKWEVEFEEVEVPTGKADLIPFINSLIEEVEANFGEEKAGGEEAE